MLFIRRIQNHTKSCYKFIPWMAFSLFLLLALRWKFFLFGLLLIIKFFDRYLWKTSCLLNKSFSFFSIIFSSSTSSSWSFIPWRCIVFWWVFFIFRAADPNLDWFQAARYIEHCFMLLIVERRADWYVELQLDDIWSPCNLVFTQSIL